MLGLRLPRGFFFRLGLFLRLAGGPVRPFQGQLRRGASLRLLPRRGGLFRLLLGAAARHVCLNNGRHLFGAAQFGQYRLFLFGAGLAEIFFIKLDGLGPLFLGHLRQQRLVQPLQKFFPGHCASPSPNSIASIFVL